MKPRKNPAGRALLARPELQRAAELFAKSVAASREHNKVAAAALKKYGEHGPQISGAVRDHFPADVKEKLRALARDVTAFSDAAHAARPARVRTGTMRALGREIATRDGSGFYGPQPNPAAMDRATAEHFYAWLEKTVPANEQHNVEQQIHALLRDHPDLIEKGRSWPEMRELAERNYPTAKNPLPFEATIDGKRYNVEELPTGELLAIHLRSMGWDGKTYSAVGERGATRLAYRTPAGRFEFVGPPLGKSERRKRPGPRELRANPAPARYRAEFSNGKKLDFNAKNDRAAVMYAEGLARRRVGAEKCLSCKQVSAVPKKKTPPMSARSTKP